MIIFLICFAVASIFLVVKPEAIARRAVRLNIYVPFLQLANARAGILQMRMFGLVMLLVTIVATLIIFRASSLY